MYNRPFSRGPWDDALNDPPSPRSFDSHEHTTHFRSRSSATAHSQSPKRLSVFSRSRSNTANTPSVVGSASSRHSPVSPMMPTEEFIPQPEERSGSALGWRSDRNSRSLLARGSRILRRQGSKVNVVATLDEEAEMAQQEKPLPDKPLPQRPERPERPDRPDRPETFRRHRSRYHENHERLKSIISDPFDFHHLTHTSAAQFQSIDHTREHDLITEFSVMRASQRPETDLKGIRAEDIQFLHSSDDDVHTPPGIAMTVDEPTRQGSPGSPRQPMGSPTFGHERRYSRQFENFSRPASRFQRRSPTTPPAQFIAESTSDAVSPAARAIDEVMSTPTTGPVDSELQSPSTHSLTQSEDLGRKMSLASYNLDDVPEEEEITRMWDSPEPSIGTAHSRSVSQASQSQAHSRSVSQLSQNAPPSAKSAVSKRPLSIVVAEELSCKVSEALGSPTLPQNLPESSCKSSPNSQLETSPSPTVAGVHSFPDEDDIYKSWDADIDYCYEHAAESSSNFDWSRNSLEEARPQITVRDTEELQPWLAAPKIRQLDPSPLSTTVIATPDLETSSTRSAPTSAATPSTADYEREFISRNAGGYFQPVNSSMLPSSLSKQMPQETLYEEYLTADGESDRHYPFPQGMMASSETNPVSPRSSFSPISKCNSQESLMLSRAASLIRKHRSSVSTNSVPELIHSLSSSREMVPLEHRASGDTLATTSSMSRPDSSYYHRQTRSLAEAQILANASSSASLASTESATTPPVSTPSNAPFHERVKSTTEMDSRLAKVQAEVNAPVPAVPAKHPGRKKSRTTSYSLFPTAAQ